MPNAWWRVVLVSSGCYDKYSSEWAAFKQWELFLRVLVAGSSRSRHQQIPCLVRAASWCLDGYLLAVTSPGEGVRALSRASLIRAPIPFTRALTSGTNHFPKANHLLILSLWRRDFNLWIWQGWGGSQTFTPYYKSRAHWTEAIITFKLKIQHKLKYHK